MALIFTFRITKTNHSNRVQKIKALRDNICLPLCSKKTVIRLLRPLSKVVLLPCRTKLIELNSTLALQLARRLKPSRATAV